MRGSLGRKLPYPGHFSTAPGQAFYPFSTSSPFNHDGGGGGRGRGRGSGDGFPTRFDPASRASPNDSAPDIQPAAPSPGMGRGRGNPAVQSSSGMSPVGRGRGGHVPESTKPIFFKKEDGFPPVMPRRTPHSWEASGGGSSLPSSILSALTGAGRGKIEMEPKSEAPPVQEENRHLRVRPPREPADGARRGGASMSRGRDEGGGRGGIGGRSGLRGGRGRGISARGRGRGRGRERGFREFREREGEESDADEGYGGGLYLGNNADGEKLAERIGPENMNKLVEGFEEMSEWVLPSPTQDMYLDAFHTNCLIEFEPEYLMEEFGTNPDIDEKPIIPLRDALEKVKPFLTVYEGIQSQEEWEEVVKETMDRVPLIQEIIDYYSGPDRITAKKQQEELDRVAKTLPASAPASVKRFTDRAVLSLQSNPGWGFDKKCIFMDQLVREISQQYK